MGRHVRKMVLGGLGGLVVILLTMLLGSQASATPAPSSQVPAVGGADACCTCTTKVNTKKKTKKAKVTVILAQSTQDVATGRYTFTVDVNPNRSGKKYYKYRLQQLVVVNGVESWMTIGTYKTQGAAELGSHTVGAGTYRIVVLGVKDCDGKVYSARIVEPAAGASSSAGGAASTTGTSTSGSSGSGAAVTNIYINDSASSGSNSNIPANTVPAAPTNVVATFRHPLSAYITWNPPTTTGGAAITRYRVVDTLYRVSCEVEAPTNSCTITGLIAGANYSFMVMAMNASGVWSAVSAASNSILAISAPTAPMAVTVSRFDTGATVTWSQPAFDGGTAITGYLVTASSGSTCQPASANTLTCNITGLDNATAYTFWVQASNGVGMSVASSRVPLAAARVPDPVLAHVSSNLVGSTLTARWVATTSDGGLGPVVYRVVIGSQEFLTSDTSITEDLAPGNVGSLSVTVFATNPVGSSAPYTFGAFFR